jgi:class 3 adenylate cyclase/TolB-like protein
MADGTAARRLASIVAIDMAGYSRRTEADEQAAVEAVARLKARVTAAVGAHGGRVFNTAGDGFMLEFPTVSGALAAAEQIAGAGDPPVRVGVHLGEVWPTESGDLLGHGVNVAARLQQLASPGAVLASGEVKRTARGTLGERLRPQGTVRLGKMSETLPVFALAPAQGGEARGRRRSLRTPLIAGAGAAVLALAGFALWPGHGLVPAADTRPSRIAILPFEPLTSGAGEQAFAGGLADELQSVLTASQLPVVSRDDAAALRGADTASRLRALGVRLLFDGTVAHDGGRLRARVHLDDPAKHLALWSVELSGPASNSGALEAQVGARAIAVMNCAGQALRPTGGLPDAEALALYLHACDLFESRVWGDDPRAVYGALDAFRRLTARAPGFAPGHSALARFLAGYRQGEALKGQPDAAAEAEREARRALALDPKDSDAYVAFALLRPVSDYAGRERLLDQALAANPSWPYANLEKANLLFDVGRSADGVGSIERAAAANPLSLNITTDIYLVANGQTAAGDAELARLQRLWPDSPQIWWDRLLVYSMEERWDDLFALLDDRQPRPKSFSDLDIQVLRTTFAAQKSRTPAAIAEAKRQLLTAPPHVPEQLQARFMALADLGLADDAFRLADRWSQAPLTAFNAPHYLFDPGGAALRRDRRFIALAAKLGLVDYWRATGRWPDFCARPDLPYDCKVEAAKAAAGKKSGRPPLG